MVKLKTNKQIFIIQNYDKIQDKNGVPDFR